MYNKVNTDMNFVEREKEVEKFWKENQLNMTVSNSKREIFSK